MNIDRMIETLDGAAGRLIVASMADSAVREAHQMVLDVSIALGEMAFEDECGDAYPSTNMTFGQAIEALKGGSRVRRKGWNGKGIFIELQRPDEHSKMTHPYIYIDSTGLQTDNPFAPKNRVPWLASQTDMLAEDWEVVEEDL